MEIKSNKTKNEIFDSSQVISVTSFKDQAYKLIKEAIIFHQFKSGEIYSQEGICKELGISRTPVREALLELQKENYVQFNRGKGIFIVPITKSEIEDIFEARLYIEKLGAKLAANRSTKEELIAFEISLEKMKKNITSHNTKLLYNLDREFHRQIFKMAKNIYFYKMNEELRDNFLRFELKTAFSDEEISVDILNEHIEIFNAIVEHDENRAEEAILNHLLRAYKRVVKVKQEY